MNELVFLGTGGSVATSERDNTSFLLAAEKDLVLVDCPGSLVQKLRRCGFDPATVGAILVTHVHPDHIYGLPSLVHSLMLREGLIRVFGSRQACSFCERLLDLFELRAPRFRTRVEFVPLDPGAMTGVGEAFEVNPLLTPHHASSLAYEVKLRATGQRAVFSGDTPVYPPLFDLARGADYLIHDCSSPSRWFEVYPILATMHTHALELGRAAGAAGVRCLIPCHFLTGDLEFSLPEVETELRAGFGGRLVLPADFERMAL